MSRVLAIHTGRIAPLKGKPGKVSAINKTPVDGPVYLSERGFENDFIADKRYHGGPHKAVCSYASEYYPLCRLHAGNEMPYGSFGENIVLEGRPDEEICIGDIYKLGDAVIQCAGPRGPCSNLSAHWQSKDLHLYIKKEKKTGGYFLVKEPGSIEAPAEFKLLERLHPEWSLVAFWEFLDRREKEPDKAEALMAMSYLDPDWEPKLRRKL